MIQKKKIQHDSLIEIELSIEERDLTIENTVLDPELERLLESAEPEGNKIRVKRTLDDLNDLLKAIARTSNHTHDKVLDASLHQIYDRLSSLESTFDIVDDQEA